MGTFGTVNKSTESHQNNMLLFVTHVVRYTILCAAERSRMPNNQTNNNDNTKIMYVFRFRMDANWTLQNGNEKLVGAAKIDFSLS